MQARIKELSPSALLTHCYAHVLNLVIVDTMNNNRIAEDFFGTLQNLYAFIETCIKRHALSLEQQRNINQTSGGEERKQEYVLKKLSDTRWACRADSIKAFHHTIEAVVATSEDIRENEKKANIAAEAKGLLRINVKEFEFILALESIFSIFYPVFEAFINMPVR